MQLNARMPRAQIRKKIPIKKRAVAAKFIPHTYTFARIRLVLKQIGTALEENEFQFLLATAIQTVHGEIANQADVLNFKSIDSLNYTAIIRFKTVHYTRVITSLLLFGEWKGTDCKFEIDDTAQTPCFLSII